MLPTALPSPATSTHRRRSLPPTAAASSHHHRRMQRQSLFFLIASAASLLHSCHLLGMFFHNSGDLLGLPPPYASLSPTTNSLPPIPSVAKPVVLREASFLPRCPKATPRPWTGRKPLPKSRNEMPEFDSFVLPSPGPFLTGMEPRYQVASREEVLEEPLTRKEVTGLVKGSLKTKLG